jgi:GTP-binding protein
MIREYLTGRINLMNSFILVDSRIPPQQSDIEYINWFGRKNLPFVILLTKTDKLSRSESKNNRETFETKLLEHWESLPRIISTSAVSKLGREEVLDYIAEVNTMFRPELL